MTDRREPDEHEQNTIEPWSGVLTTVSVISRDILIQASFIGDRTPSTVLLYRVGLPAVNAKTKDHATLAHFVVVRPVTGHSCSAGDGAPYDVLGFLTLHRVRPQ